MASPDGRSALSRLWPRALCFPLVLAVAGLGLLLLGMEAARPCYFLHDDNADWFIGAYLHDFRVLTETGRPAEVNYFQHGGEPFVEQGQTAVLYPPIYLSVALAKWVTGDVRWSLEWLAAMHLTIGLLGFYFWMRQGGMAGRFAALGGLAWALNPFVLTIGDSWIFVTFVAAWLPWLFWALDRLLARPSPRAALYLGVIAALLFLQGYVQYFAYALVFLIPYALFQFVTRSHARKPAALYYLAVSVLVFAILALPLLLPMLHAIGISSYRSEAQSEFDALYFSSEWGEILPAQLCQFQHWVVFGASSVIYYCPALLLMPVMLLRLIFAHAEMRRRLFLLLFLGALALILSTNWHWVLSQLPGFNRFRWPFKVYLFADFFLTAALTWTAAAWTEAHPARPRLALLAATACLALVVVGNGGNALAFHDETLLSQTDLSATLKPLAPGMDPRLGRAVTYAEDVSQADAGYFLTRAYATYFEFPCLGGYNPLVRLHVQEWALYLDYPNISSGPIDHDFQQQYEARGVRYWIVDAHSPNFAEISNLPGLRPLEKTADRVVYEDTHAAPLAFSTANPTVPCALTFSGNSMLIALRGVASPVAVSVTPTDGWWYRIDYGIERGPWLKPKDVDDRLIIPFDATGVQVEVSYFDPRFWLALEWSGGLLLVLVIMLPVGRRLFYDHPSPLRDTSTAAQGGQDQ